MRSGRESVLRSNPQHGQRGNLRSRRTIHDESRARSSLREQRISVIHQRCESPPVFAHTKNPNRLALHFRKDSPLIVGSLPVHYCLAVVRMFHLASGLSWFVVRGVEIGWELGEVEYLLPE